MQLKPQAQSISRFKKQAFRVTTLLATVAIITVMAVFALDTTEHGGYIEYYAPWAYDDVYISYCNEWPGEIYYYGPIYLCGEYGLGEICSYDPTEIPYDSYAEYDSSYVGEAYDSYAEYGYVVEDYIGYAPTIYTQPTFIAIDYYGNITTNPPDIQPGIVFDGVYIQINFPVMLSYEDVSLTIPDGWTYTIRHDYVETPAYAGGGEVFMGAVSHVYTLVTVRHTWLDNLSVGFTPFVAGVPGGYATSNVSTHLELVTAVNTNINQNRVISIQNSFDMTGAVTITGNRHVIIATRDTNVSTHVPGATPRVSLNRIAGIGRHFIVHDGVTLTLSNIILDGHVGVASTAVNYNRGGVFVGGVPISTPQAPRVGGARLILQNGASIRRNSWSIGTPALQLPGTHLGTTNTGGTGAGVNANGGMEAGYASGGSRVYMHAGSEVVDNLTTTNWGGGVHVQNGGHLVMHGGEIARNRTFRTAAAGNGNAAGVHVGSAELFTSTFVMYNGAVRNNRAYATRSDGADTIFRAGGAGVFVHQFCTFHMHGGYIEGNVLSGNRLPGAEGSFILNGAGVLLLGRSAATAEADATRVYMHGGHIRSNTVSMETAGVDGVLGGGGVGLYGGVFTLVNGTISGNSADEGGGVYVNTGGGGGTVIMYNGSISLNRANYGAGVGINPQIDAPAGVWGTTSFTMHGGTIGNNTQNPAFGLPTRGGGVFVHGGAAHTDQDSDRRLAGTFIMNGGHIVGNTAVRGGGVYMGRGLDGGSAAYFGGHGAELDLVWATITANNATYGGGIYGSGNVLVGTYAWVGRSPRLIVRGGTVIHSNRAVYGGGVHLNNAMFTMTGGIIRSHVLQPWPSTATIVAGGGVYITGTNALFTMTGGIIGDNDPAPGNSAQRGGGVYVTGGAIFNMNQDGTPPHFTSGTIIGNIATGTVMASDGGGGVMLHNGEFTMSAGIIQANQSIRGGGVRVDTGTFYMYGGVIRGNIVDRTLPSHNLIGGGVAVNGINANFNMRGGIIGGTTEAESNLAHSGGGVGVYNGGIFRMEAGPGGSYGRIIGNYAFGTSVNDGGGGVVVTDLAETPFGSSFVMEAGVIGGSYEEDQGNYSIHGGGVFVRWSGQMTMTGGQISGNEATLIGGGVALCHSNEGSTTQFTMKGGTIGGINPGEGNSAINGGGTRIGGSATFNMEGGYITANRAASNGGGVFVSGVSSEASGSIPAVFNMTGGTIGGPRACDHDCECAPSNCVPYDLGNTAVNGGGVLAGNGAVFNLQGNDAKTITGNTAEHDGGGVWVAATSEMDVDSAAGNINITYNKAGDMGGGIFTADYCYNAPLVRVPPTPGGTMPGGQTIAYGNLSLTTAITFTGNRANRRYVPPSNTAYVPHLAFAGTNTSQPANAVRIHPLNNYDINFRAPGHDFRFYKTDHQLYDNPRQVVPLAGARFRIFRTDANPITTPELGMDTPGLITFDPTGAPNTPWVEVNMLGDIHLSPGGFGVPLGFEMIPGFTYQLVEYMAPSGFQIPFGQWRLTHNTAATHSVAIQHIGGNAPAFVPNDSFLRPDITTAQWFVGNWPVFQLPLTGGTGITAIMVAGGAVIAIAIAAIPALKAKNMGKGGRKSTKC